MEALAKRHQGRAQFLFIYGQEAHADSERTLASFQAEGCPFPESLRQAQSRAERAEYAACFRQRMEGGVRRILVDEDGQNNVEDQYLAGIRLLVLVDRHQRIVLSGTYVAVPLLEETLQRRLQEDSPGQPASAGRPAASAPPS